MSSQRGSRYERELVNRLDTHGYGSLRLPSSGSATSRDLPDVLVGQPLDSNTTVVWAVEAKSGKATTLYAEEDEVRDLESFCETWGATPYLSARFTRRSADTRHYLIRPAYARRTDGGNYGLPVAELEERAEIAVGPDAVTHLIEPDPRYSRGGKA